MMENRVFALKGAVVYTEEKERFICHDNAYVVCENGVSAGVYRELPANYKDIQVMDYGSHVIIPGLCDLHLHAPQYGFRGLGRNIEAAGEPGLISMRFPRKAITGIWNMRPGHMNVLPMI